MLDSNTTATQSATTTAPGADNLKTLAGAFISIKAANKGIALMSEMPKVDIKGLENVNDSLAAAQKNVTYWDKTVSANVQNQLQLIVDHSDLFSELAPSILEGLKTLQDTQNPTSTGLLTDLSEEFSALQDNIRQILYGNGGTEAKPEEASVLGAYKQMLDYQSLVAEDKRVFNHYFDLATSENTGITDQIKSLNDNISTYRQAINHDQIMIAGGAAAVATGIGLVVCGAALEIPTAGVSTGLIVAGGVMIAGGAGAGIYGIADLVKKQELVTDALKQIQNLNGELASLISIGKSSHDISDHANTIYGALGIVITNWQQMDNLMEDTILALNSPEEKLNEWIEKKTNGEKTPSYKIMGVILEAEVKSSSHDWAEAAALADNLLKGIANVKDITLPKNTIPTQETVDAAYERAAA